AFALIAVVVGVGAVVGRTGVLGENARMVLNRTAFHIGVPALMLITLADTAPAEVFSPTLLISAITAFALFGSYFVLARRVLGRPRGDAAIGASASSIVNAGNLGLPLSTYVFGSTTEVSAIILLQYVLLVPLSLAILDSESEEPRSVGYRLKALVTTPIIAASAVGIALAVTNIELPPALHDPLELLSALTIPTVLLAFGMSLSARADRPPRPKRVELALAVLFKNALMPLIAYALARWCFHADAHQIMLVTVLAALPAAQNINTYAAVYGRGEGLARDASLLSTVLSVPVIVAIVALTGP
ncbi:MAG: rane protein, partial [Mycobacterium sp.]|nr:rane protein [Mycobacterium sp.]